jgi:hypothetical protein
VASIFCSQSVPDFVQLECGSELGGIIAMALIEKDEAPSLIDLQTLSFWTTKVAASPAKYFIVKDTRGSYPGGTPVEEEGYGKTPTLRTGADHEANLEVRGVLNNRTFWARVNQTDKWIVVLITNGEIGHYIEDVSVYAKQIIDQSIKSTARMSVNLKWSDDLSNPLVFDASPLDSIFNN